MSKTNHRINKDRGEKLGESDAHKSRRQVNLKFRELIEIYEDDEPLDEEFEEWDRHEKRPKGVGNGKSK